MNQRGRALKRDGSRGHDTTVQRANMCPKCAQVVGLRAEQKTEQVSASAAHASGKKIKVAVEKNK